MNLIVRLTSSLYMPDRKLETRNDPSIEEWINLSNTQFLTESALSCQKGSGDASNAHTLHLSKKSLMKKLDCISKGK